MGENEKQHYKGFGKKTLKKIFFEVLDIHWRIILTLSSPWCHMASLGWKGFRWIFKTYNGRVWIGLIWLRTGTGGGFCEYGEQLSGSVQSEEFLISWGTISFSCRTLHHVVT
jgi:hypothetical protein